MYFLLDRHKNGRAWRHRRVSRASTWNHFDDEGNLTKKSKGATQETWTFGYDQTNHLIIAKHSATDGGAIDKQIDFKYDAWGNRLEKSYDADGAGSGSAVVTKFAIDGWNPAKPTPVGNENFDVWADLDGSGSLTTRYLRGDAVDQVFARIASGSGCYFLNDHLGSIREIAQASSGNIVDTVTYDGFGNITAETDSTKRGRYAWTGRELDGEIGLQYNRARYYDAATGRWISQDPLGFDAGDGNLYRYVSNKPTSSRDPSGLDDWTVETARATLENDIKRWKKQGWNLAADFLEKFLDTKLDRNALYVVKDQALIDEAKKDSKDMVRRILRDVLDEKYGPGDDPQIGAVLSWQGRVRWMPTGNNVSILGYQHGQFLNSTGGSLFSSTNYIEKSNNLFFAYGGAELKIEGKITGVQRPTAPGSKCFTVDVSAKVTITDNYTFAPGGLRLLAESYSAARFLQFFEKSPYQPYDNRLSFEEKYAVYNGLFRR